MDKGALEIRGVRRFITMRRTKKRSKEGGKYEEKEKEKTYHKITSSNERIPFLKRQSISHKMYKRIEQSREKRIRSSLKPKVNNPPNQHQSIIIKNSHPPYTPPHQAPLIPHRIKTGNNRLTTSTASPVSPLFTVKDGTDGLSWAIKIEARESS